MNVVLFTIFVDFNGLPICTLYFGTYSYIADCMIHNDVLYIVKIIEITCFNCFHKPFDELLYFCATVL